MRVAIVTEVWHPSVNGVVTRLQATVDELRRAGHDVLVVAPRVPPTQRRDPPTIRAAGTGTLTVRTVPTFHLRFLYGGQPWGFPLPRVGRYLAAFEPDVVHVVNPTMLGMAGVGAARRNCWPLVCSYHTDIVAYARSYHLGWLRPVIWWVLRQLHGRAAINLVTSHNSAARLAAEGIGQHPAGPGRIELWPRGVELGRFRPDRGTGPGGRRGRRPGDPIRAIYVGRLASEKGIGALTEVARAPDIHLVLVGDGPQRQELTERLAGYGVTFTGVLHGDQLARAYQDADVFIFPSLTDTLGLCLIEAMASGLPCVAADSPSSREVLGALPFARLFPPGDPAQVPGIIRELLHAAPPEVHAARARAEVSGHSWASATAKLCAFYREAMAMAPARRSRRPAARPGMAQRMGRFTVVGVTNAVIDLGVYNALLALFPTTSTATKVWFNTIAVLAALSNSWLWNSRWTFRDRGHHVAEGRLRRRLLFVAQGIFNVGVNDATVAVVATIFSAAGVLQGTLGSNLAKLAAMVTASLSSFAAMHFVVFRHPSCALPPPYPDPELLDEPPTVRIAQKTGT